MAKATNTVVKQFPWAAVKKQIREDGIASYDVWQWNLFKMKWVRLANTACGFGSASDAAVSAKELSDEIDQMFKNNKNPPPSL